MRRSGGSFSGVLQKIKRVILPFFIKTAPPPAPGTAGNSPVNWFGVSRPLFLSGVLLAAGFILWLSMFSGRGTFLGAISGAFQTVPVLLFILLGLFLLAGEIDKWKIVEGKKTVKECSFAASFLLFHFINDVCFRTLSGPIRYVLIAASAACIVASSEFRIHVLFSCAVDFYYFMLTSVSRNGLSFAPVCMCFIRGLAGLWLVRAFGSFITEILGSSRGKMALFIKRLVYCAFIAGMVIYAGTLGLLKPVTDLLPARQARTENSTGNQVELQPQATSVSYRTGFTNKPQVNLREQGVAHAKVLRRVEKNSDLLVLSTTTDENGTKWYYVEVDGERGYIRSDLVTLTGM